MKTNMHSKFLIMTALMLVSACTVDVGGKKVVDTGGGKSTKVSYDFTEGTCNTGRHEFDSMEAMCAALQSSSINNNGCAPNLREAKFKESCPGTFNPQG
jgi:hypothetical protein